MSSNRMAVSTDYFTLSNLRLYCYPPAITANHIRNISELIATNMVKLEYAGVSAAAIMTAQGSLINFDSSPLDSAKPIPSFISSH